jgi:hypothetical protein
VAGTPAAWLSPTVRFRVLTASVEADGRVGEWVEEVEIAVAELARLWGKRDVQSFNLIDRHSDEPPRRFVGVEILPPKRQRRT